MIEARIDLELQLLRARFPDLEYLDRWVRLPSIGLPPDWTPEQIDVSFFIREPFPGTGPYGIYVPVGILFKGAKPNQYTEPAATQPPFDGEWGMFSWEASDWRASADPRTGHNLLNWVLGVTGRFREGC